MPHRWFTGPEPLAAGDPERVGGHTLAGRLGEGRSGTVYAALGHDSQPFALRVFHSGFAEDPGFRARLRREVDLVRGISGPFVARLLTADPDAPRPWLATELVPGPALDRWVRHEGPLRGGALLGVAVGTLDALRTLHSRGAVHRDLRPGNVLLTSGGPRVLDAGIARALDATVLSRTGGPCGDSGWIAPERYREGVSAPGGDVFAWGALTALAATGREPFGTGTPQEVAGRVLWEEPDLEGVPADLLSPVEAALDKDPDRRPGVGDLLRELTGQAESSEEAVAAAGRDWPGSTRPPERRGRWSWRWPGPLTLLRPQGH